MEETFVGLAGGCSALQPPAQRSEGPRQLPGALARRRRQPSHKGSRGCLKNEPNLFPPFEPIMCICLYIHIYHLCGLKTPKTIKCLIFLYFRHVHILFFHSSSTSISNTIFDRKNSYTTQKMTSKNTTKTAKISPRALFGRR